MADPRNDDVAGTAPTSPVAAADGRAPRFAPDRLNARPARRAVWLVLCLAVFGFVAFGSVTVYEADGEARRMSVVRVWAMLGDGLPRVGHATLVNTVFVAALLVLIAASLAASWLALVGVEATTDEDASNATVGAGEPLAADGAADRDGA